MKNIIENLLKGYKKQIMNKISFIKSPLNYTGGKYNLLDKLIPLFPNKIDNFLDLFGGGFNVGININANKIIYNDNITQLKNLLEYFYINDFYSIEKKINELISNYNLSKINVNGYNNLRDFYNNSNNIKDKDIVLFTLICFSFNHLIRFNSELKFNTPFGKNRSSYNDNIKRNLHEFISAMKKKDISFFNEDFRFFEKFKFSKKDFIYCDPPYLITTASYNDGKRGFSGWGIEDEKKLLNMLDEWNKKGLKFALSNVFYANNNENRILIDWAKKYKVIYINQNYNNSNYRRKNKDDVVEVLIINY